MIMGFHEYTYQDREYIIKVQCTAILLDRSKTGGAATPLAPPCPPPCLHPSTGGQLLLKSKQENQTARVTQEVVLNECGDVVSCVHALTKPQGSISYSDESPTALTEVERVLRKSSWEENQTKLIRQSCSNFRISYKFKQAGLAEEFFS